MLRTVTLAAVLVVPALAAEPPRTTTRDVDRLVLRQTMRARAAR